MHRTNGMGITDLLTDEWCGVTTQVPLRWEKPLNNHTRRRTGLVWAGCVDQANHPAQDSSFGWLMALASDLCAKRSTPVLNRSVLKT